MSKSDSDGKATILLTDSDDDIRKKIRKAVTDFTPQVSRLAAMARSPSPVFTYIQSFFAVR